MATIKALKTKLEDGTEQVVFPKTLPEAIIDPETNETLDVILNNLNEKIDNIEPGGGGEIPTDVQEQLDGKVSKSGDTMTDTLNISSPNFPALNLTREGTTTNYTAIQFNNDNGMLGGLGMNTPSGDMVVMNEDGVGYPMLDKRNYNQYALPLSGGTVTGASTFSSLLTASNGLVVARQANEANWGDKGYNVIAKIVVKRKYMSNSNLMLTLSSFGDRTRAEGKIYVQFGNVGTAASTTVLKVSTCGTPAIYYVLTSDTSADTATLELIATKAGYENFAIINISTSSHFRARADITFPMTFESSLRSGAIAATTYTMLDSDNYSSYALPLTGGKITGGLTITDGFYSTGEQTALYRDYYCFNTTQGAGKAGYWKLCTITITGEYAGSVIEFDMTCRYGFGKLYVSFNGTTDISAYKVAVFKQTGGLRQCYIVKTSGTSSGSVFDIYVEKEEAWGDLTVTHMKFPVHMRSKCSLVWSGAYASSLPSGENQAELGNDGMVSGDLKKGSNSVSIKYVRSTIILCVDVTDTVGTYLITPRANSAGSFDIKELAITGTSISVSASGTTLTIVSQNSGRYTYIEIL